MFVTFPMFIGIIIGHTVYYTKFISKTKIADIKARPLREGGGLRA